VVCVRLARLALSLGVVACANGDAPAPAGRPVDLTHPFDAQTVYWPTEEGFVLERGFAGLTEAGYYYEAHRFRAAEHGGTHLDAPVHFAQGRPAVDAIPLARLSGPARVVDVSEACARDADHQISAADLARFEGEEGRLPDGAVLLLRTGWASRWPDREAYLGTAQRGPAAVAHLRFPGLHPDAARWLVRERRVAAVGIDTASIDYGRSTLFETHRILFEAEIPVFENVAALDRLPARGAFVVALPMKIRDGSGAPLRIVAWVP
jgi:kynurenine formamidase